MVANKIPDAECKMVTLKIDRRTVEVKKVRPSLVRRSLLGSWIPTLLPERNQRNWSVQGVCVVELKGSARL